MPKAAAKPDESTVLVIEGDWARMQRTITERQVKTSALLEELARQQPLATGMLPKGCIHYARRPSKDGTDHQLYTLERPAGIVTLRYKEGASRDDQRDENISQLDLSWPFTQWTIRFAGGTTLVDVHITCTKSPVGALDDLLYVLPMPNIHGGGHGEVCVGNLELPEALPVAVRAERIVTAILESLWNNDLLPDYEPLKLEGLRDWAARSAQDPRFGLTLEYQPHRGKDLAGLLEVLMGEQP